MRRRRHVWQVLTLAVLLAGCKERVKVCPDGMVADRETQPKAGAAGPGREQWCKSPDGQRSRWTEFYGASDKRRQSCTYNDGRAEGSYLAWHENGRVWIEGVYRFGNKSGKWVQYDEAGSLIARGEYRDGRFVGGAPVARMVRCEELTP